MCALSRTTGHFKNVVRRKELGLNLVESSGSPEEEGHEGVADDTGPVEDLEVML